MLWPIFILSYLTNSKLVIATKRNRVLTKGKVSNEIFNSWISITLLRISMPVDSGGTFSEKSQDVLDGF